MAVQFVLNLKYLRKKRHWRQSEIANLLGVTRSSYASYEEGRAEPSLGVLQQISALHGIGLDSLICVDLSSDFNGHDVSGTSLRVLSVSVTPDNEETAVVVPIKAAAGYAGAYGDIEFIEHLPQVVLPIPEFRSGFTRRLFQIEGDSMLPIKSGSYVVARYIQDWTWIKPLQCVVVVTRQSGIVYKRLAESVYGKLHLSSDNRQYSDMELDIDEVREIWLAEGYIATQLPLPGESIPDMATLIHEFQGLRKELKAEREGKATT